MSAPQTDLERQKRRHRGPLIGIIAALIVAGLLFVVFFGDMISPQDSLLGDGPNAVSPDTAPVVDAPAPVPAN